MTATTTVTGSEDKAPVVQPPQRGNIFAKIAAPYRHSHGIQRFMLVSGTAVSILLILTAIFAPLIAPYSFDTYQDAAGRFPQQGEPTARNHWGTTVQGFDVMSRTIYGARTAVEVVILAVVFSIAIGVPLGLISGYIGGWLDRILVLIMDALFAFPYLLLAIVAAFLLKNTIDSGIVVTAIAITVVYVPQYFRVVRASTLSARESTYIEAARAMGARPSVIIRKYLFGNVVQSVPVIATLNAADAILTLAGLGFLGLGIQPTQAAEWGYDLQRAVADAGAGIWWTALYPGLGIVIAVTALTLVGEGLNDVLNPTLRRRNVKRPDVQRRAIGSSAVGPATAPDVEEEAGR
ncbi:ABC transporter permease [Solirubrobacter ginsenosidimutans]|uniref:ABC transporter permease n=1 Tax=Solirubrobacter ginsenosidimutans TaxID=490573 RepID=A0A9X3MZR1_9ACTN|nr:ABC transporter permease [Solirubrobacter ginsenosidimutans]MDA0165507.1 ABC transporter permease [Solirubrobacter ginsenosidimutans]